jgi:hypothetical protein
LRLAIAAEQQHARALAEAADGLAEQRLAERRCACSSPLPADHWFSHSASRLSRLAEEGRASAARLALLRAEATQARARLSLLEEAERSNRAASARAREGRRQAALDDRTATGWCDRR